MNLVDANVLLYAADPGAEHHGVARGWLEEALNSTSTLLLPWVSALATHPRLFDRPLATQSAFDVLDGWLARANVRVPHPDARHAARMRELLLDTGGRGGNLVNDAHLAALALQEGAAVATFDRNFGRFRGVRSFVPA